MKKAAKVPAMNYDIDHNLFSCSVLCLLFIQHAQRSLHFMQSFIICDTDTGVEATAWAAVVLSTKQSHFISYTKL
jgi:hypothetical protein